MSGRALRVVFATLALGGLASTALAEGQGRYRVQGVEAGGRSPYSGTATLTQTGPETWRVVWQIGRTTWTASGLGDGRIIAVNFSSGGQTGVSLFISKGDGTGYRGIWSYTGATDVGKEEWTKE